MTTNEKAYVARVDEEHGRCADPRDQQAGEDRAAELRDLLRRLHEGRPLRDELLVVTEHLREDQARGRVVRRHEAAEQEREREQRRKARWPVQCRTGIAAISGIRAASATFIVRLAPSRAITTAGRDAEEPDREELRREDPAHLRGRARREQDEPRERHERHRRAGQRDELGGEDRGEGAVPEDRSSRKIIRRTYGFVK